MLETHQLIEFDNMLCVHDVAKILQVPIVTAYKLTQQNEIPNVKVDRRILVSKYQLAMWIQAHEMQTLGR